LLTLVGFLSAAQAYEYRHSDFPVEHRDRDHDRR
jgi:hypothetical protein